MDVILINSSTITINTSDLNRSIQFYTSIGFSLRQRWDDHYAEMEAPGIKIGLHPVPDEAHVTGSGSTSIGFIANDFSAVKSKLESLKIACRARKEEGGEFLHFQDPDGTALYFINPKW